MPQAAEVPWPRLPVDISGRGDILVVIDVAVPARLTAEEKKLVEQLSQGPSFRSAEGASRENIFDRMRSFFR